MLPIDENSLLRHYWHQTPKCYIVVRSILMASHNEDVIRLRISGMGTIAKFYFMWALDRSKVTCSPSLDRFISCLTLTFCLTAGRCFMMLSVVSQGHTTRGQELWGFYARAGRRSKELRLLNESSFCGWPVSSNCGTLDSNCSIGPCLSFVVEDITSIELSHSKTNMNSTDFSDCFVVLFGHSTCALSPEPQGLHQPSLRVWI